MDVPPRNPIAAVTHPDPYPYYAALRESASPIFHAGIGAWVASRAEHVERVLTHPAFRVRPVREPVPRSIDGLPAGAVFREFARMSDGERHATLRARVDRRLASSTIASLEDRAGCAAEQLRTLDTDEFIERFAVYAVASALNAPADDLACIFERVRAFARSLASDASADAVTNGSTATRALRERFDATEIGLLFQSYEAMHGLIGNALAALSRQDGSDSLEAHVEATLRKDSAVQNTRRFLAEVAVISGIRMRRGDTVLAILAAANRDPTASDRIYTFGLGGHACPARHIAVRIAAAALRHLAAGGLNLRHCRPVTYRPSPNVRIPLFARARSRKVPS